MKSAFDLANSLHKHSRRPSSLLSKAARRLKEQKATPLGFGKDDVSKVEHVSHFLYHLDVGRRLLVSMVFNRDDIPRLVSRNFGTVVLRRVYQSVWYDLELR